MKNPLIAIFLFTLMIGYSQNDINETLTLSEYIGYVKKYHPIVKQAQLITTQSEVKLLKARGAFDPKIEVDYDRKKFKNTEYFDKLNTTFKIPTWYGVELKGNYEKNSGDFLNLESKVPDDGLYAAGVSIPLARGLLTNERMATLKKAKLYVKQAKEDQNIQVNNILFEAIVTYLDWLKQYQNQNVYKDFLENAKVRLKNVKISFEAGDKPAVDTLEANINLKNRLLDLEKSKLKYLKSKLKLSNFLWLQNNVPLELEDAIIPETNTIQSIDAALDLKPIKKDSTIVNSHSKIKSLQFKKEGLIVDKRLKLNNLLPRIDAEYNFLTPKFNTITNFDTNNYKGGLNVNIPLFLRKERSDLKLAKLKLQDIDFIISSEKVNLTNKLDFIENEIISYTEQNKILYQLVNDYKRLVSAEERKFVLGEGSLFLINYREVKLIESQLKLIDSEYNFLNSKASIYRFLNNL